MSVNNGVISAPVSISDIQTAIGAAGGGDLGTLCQHENINMWSKFKPVICRTAGLVDTTGQLNGTVWNLNVQSPWWRDTQYGEGVLIINCTYGIKSQRGGSLANVYARYTDGDEWTYAKPTGGNAAPYRQLDFLQYNHNASHPLGSISAPSSLILSSAADGGWSIDVAMMKNQDDDLPIAQRDYVTPEDILTELWGSCYFGFALIDKADDQAKIWVTGNRYYGLGTNGGRLDAGHVYYVMPFYTNSALPQDDSGQNLNPIPATIPGGTLFATVPNIDLPELVIPSSSITRDDARFSVRGVLQNGRLQVTAIVNAEDLVETYGTVKFNGGQYRQVVIYVCQAGTMPDSYGTLDPNKIIASRSFYSYSSPLSVSSGQKATIGGSVQTFTGITVEKCRIFVYAGNGHLSDTGMTARCSGDAMVSEGTIEPTAIII